MAKLARKTQKIFAKDGSLGRFGSAALGSPTVSSAGDLSDMQSLSAYTNGWADGVINGDKRPPLEEFNTLHYINNYQTSYLFQEGIAEYDAGTTYYIDSFVKSSGVVYKSLIDSNIGVSLSNTASWQVLGDLKTSVNVKMIDNKSDLPAAVSNVITLEAKSYIISAEIDLTGDRLVAVEGTSIIGLSTNSSKILSTGLTGNPLITSNYGLTLRHITLEAETPFNLDASANPGEALDWTSVSLVNCTNQGIIKSYDNFASVLLAIIDSSGISFDGTIGSAVFSNSFFDTSSTNKALSFLSTCTITRRIRVSESAFVIASGETGVEIVSGATIPNESVIIDLCNFSGGGTYLSGIASSDLKSRFIQDDGIDNSLSVGQMYMNNNATATTIASAGTYYKVAGTTTAGSNIERFTHTSGRLTYNGVSAKFDISATFSFTGTNNKVLRFRIAKNGTAIASTQMSRTINASGAYANMVIQDVVSLVATDYIEIFCTNSTDTNSITVSDLNVKIIKA